MPKNATTLLYEHVEQFEENYKVHYSCTTYASNSNDKIYSAVIKVKDGYVEVTAKKDNTVRVFCRYTHEQKFPEITVSGYKNCKLLFEILTTILDCSKYGNATTQDINDAIMCLVQLAYQEQF